MRRWHKDDQKKDGNEQQAVNAHAGLRLRSRWKPSSVRGFPIVSRLTASGIQESVPNVPSGSEMVFHDGPAPSRATPPAARVLTSRPV